MKLIMIPVVLLLFAAVPGSALAGPCDEGRKEECLALMSDVDRAIAWLTEKQAKDPVATQAALDQCNSKVAPGADISVLLNCMMNILGP